MKTLTNERKRINLTKIIERKRKFLIADRLNVRKLFPNCEICEINQYYLPHLCTPAKDIRVRATTINGVPSYYMSIKYKDKKDLLVEKHEITLENFSEILSKSPYMPLSKTRFNFAYKGYRAKIDEYNGLPIDMKILTIYFDSDEEKKNFTIREPWILREITDDEGYKNLNIWRKHYNAEIKV